MGFAREVADTVWFMDEGRIVETAEPERFFTAPESDRARRFPAEIRRCVQAQAGVERRRPGSVRIRSWKREHFTCTSLRSCRRSAVSAPPQTQPVSRQITSGAAAGPAWTNGRIRWTSRGAIGHVEPGHQVGGQAPGATLVANSMWPLGAQADAGQRVDDDAHALAARGLPSRWPVRCRTSSAAPSASSARAARPEPRRPAPGSWPRPISPACRRGPSGGSARNARAGESVASRSRRRRRARGGCPPACRT